MPSSEQVLITSISKDVLANTITAANVVRAVTACRRVVRATWSAEQNRIEFWATVPLPRSAAQHLAQPPEHP